MKPIYLFMEDFMCHEVSELDLSSFNSALVVGKLADNDLYSNGVGKSTIFKSIEFCLFNECAKGLKLDKLVRDEAAKCRVVFDFESDNKIYRISRSRTRKGVADLSLFERTAVQEDGINPHAIFKDEDIFKKFWNDITGRRASDTEENLFKIHKMNYEAFCSGYYFSQEDNNFGLATATKSNRKKILKDSLQLIIYSFLLKLTNSRASVLSKEIDKKSTILSTIGDPSKEVVDFEEKLQNIITLIQKQDETMELTSHNLNLISLSLNELKIKNKVLSEQLNSSIEKKKDISDKIIKIKSSISDYELKKKAIANNAKTLIEETKSLKEDKTKLEANKFNDIQLLLNNLEEGKASFSEKNAIIKSLKEEISELKIPLPQEDFCKHCRQPLTEEHREQCKRSNQNKIVTSEEQIKVLLKDSETIIKTNKELSDKINNLQNAKSKLDTISQKIIVKEKEITDKKTLFSEYNSISKKYTAELKDLEDTLVKIDLEINANGSSELREVKAAILTKELDYNTLKHNYNYESAILAKISNDKAVLEHSVLEKKKDIEKKKILQEELKKAEEDYIVFPDLIEAFGPTGIPNSIIHNVLDDLQAEANDILEQIRPGLQLNFIIEKTRGDGQQDDELDIEYFLNGKSRDYAQLSGAQKLCVMFSLKLGVAHLLKKKIGISFNMLLLDEVDQALDKASVDAFAEIIKFFQTEFTILVITHNDRLKGKFSHVILVEQDQSLVSKAKIVSSW